MTNSDDRRWTLYCNHEADGTWCFDAHGVPIPEGELVCVMPLAAHAAALKAARQVDDESVERAARAIAELNGSTPERGRYREEARVALSAAFVIPWTDTGTNMSAGANGLSVPEPEEKR